MPTGANSGDFVVKINLKDLLKRALMVDAQEVRLVPGRRTVVITASGENEVRGDVQTPERINAMIEPLMSAEARRSLATGWAEWNFELEGHGTVRATAELKMGLVHASFDLAAAAGSADLLEAEPLTPAPVPEPIAPIQPAPVVIQTRQEQPPTQANPGLGRPIPINPTLQSMRKLDTVPPAPARSRWDAGVSGGSTAEIDRLLSKMVELKASDLHISTGSPPMIRLDGDMVAM